MRQLLPHPIDDVDVVAAYAADARPRPADRPWVVVNMIASVDGGTAVDGRSGALGGPGDKAVFGALRAAADLVLVGAATVRAEGYGPSKSGVRIAVVTASGDLDPGSRLFTGGPRPLVVTCERCPPDRRRALEAVADVVVAGDERVDLAAALATFDDAGVVLAEGGPSLNGQLVAGDLVDEWCLTLSPLLLGGASSRPAVGPPPAGGLTRMRLDRLLTDGELCFARYVRA